MPQVTKEIQITKKQDTNNKSQPCPKCGYPIGNIAGSKEAICINCGFKDPCCE